MPDGTIQINTASGSPVNDLKIQSNRIETNIAFNTIFNFSSTIDFIEDYGHILSPVNGSENVANIFSDSGQSLGLESGDKITIQGSIADSIIADSAYFLSGKPSSIIISSLNDLLLFIRNSLKLPETDSTYQNNPSVSVNPAGSNDSIADGSIVIRGRKGCAFRLSDIIISANNSNNNALNSTSILSTRTLRSQSLS
jgi:hypothetical protein